MRLAGCCFGSMATMAAALCMRWVCAIAIALADLAARAMVEPAKPQPCAFAGSAQIARASRVAHTPRHARPAGQRRAAHAPGSRAHVRSAAEPSPDPPGPLRGARPRSLTLRSRRCAEISVQVVWPTAGMFVVSILCCCPFELTGRLSQTPIHPLARSASRQARAIRPAHKLALWAGTPVRARVGLTGRTRTRTRRTRAPRVVCVCSIRSRDPSLPSLGRPRLVPAAPNFSHLGQHQSFTSKRPLNVHKGQQCGCRALQRLGPQLQTSARPPPRTSESMATPAMDDNAMASALWQSAKAGNTAEASRLLDEGTPLDWQNAADVSSETVGTLLTCCRGNGARNNEAGVSVPPMGLLHRGSRGKMCRPSTVMAMAAESLRAGWLWVACGRWHQRHCVGVMVVESTWPRRMVLRRLLWLRPVGTRTRWSCCWTGVPTWKPRMR